MTRTDLHPLPPGAKAFWLAYTVAVGGLPWLIL